MFRSFAYDGTDPIAEYDASNALQRRYVFGPSSNEPIVQYEGSGTPARYWLHSDERGSIVAMSDGSGSAIVTNSYDEYGKPGATNGGRFMYTGQMYVPEAAAYWYKARMYEPALGRFLQTDPVGYDGGMNLYAYVGNDPLNATDPTGLVQDMPTLHLPYSSGGLGFYNLVLQKTEFSSTGSITSVEYGYADQGGVFAEPPGYYTWVNGRAGSVSGSDKLIIVTASTSGHWVLAGSDGISTGHNFIYTNPSFFTHVAERHYGWDTLHESQFDQRFQNAVSTFSLAAFAANNSVMRPSYGGYFTYTARYGSSVGYEFGTGNPTNYVTLVVDPLGYPAGNGLPAYNAITLFPGWPR